MVSLDDITGVREHVEKRLNTKLSQRSSEINGAIFDEDNVLEVIDSLDNTNYSLRFRFPNTPIKEFYNLVVGRTPQGELKTPYVLKYTCDDASLDEFISNEFNFYYFKGIVAIHKYTDFFEAGNFSRTNTECETQFDAAGDPISCENNYIDGSTSTSGGGSTGSSTGTGNNGGGSNGDGSTGGGSFSSGSSYLGIYVKNCGGSNTDVLHLKDECGGPNKKFADEFAVWDCEGATRSARTADCPECGGDSEGAVGINPPSMSTMLNTVIDALSLPRGSVELSFLENNPDVTNSLCNFLDAHGINGNYIPEALTFVDEVITAAVNNPNISSEDVITMIDLFWVNDWVRKLKEALATGITTTAELAHDIYNKISEVLEEYPELLDTFNVGVNALREIAELATDTNSQTATWADLFNMWLSELGVNPMNFDVDDITTEDLKNQEGVNEARNKALDLISQGQFDILPHTWQYGQDEFYDGMANGNIATAFLGSYIVSITAIQNANGTATLTFTINNTSGWESATRLRIDNDNNDQHDEIIPNKPRGVGILLGGNFSQTWTWSETHN